MLDFGNLVRTLYFLFLLRYATTLTMPLEKKYKQMVRQVLKQGGINGEWKKSPNYYKLYMNNNQHYHKTGSNNAI
jgi:hypothetical protein